jgi:hypothetical protein
VTWDGRRGHQGIGVARKGGLAQALEDGSGQERRIGLGRREEKRRAGIDEGGAGVVAFREGGGEVEIGFGQALGRGGDQGEAEGLSGPDPPPQVEECGVARKLRDGGEKGPRLVPPVLRGDDLDLGEKAAAGALHPLGFGEREDRLGPGQVARKGKGQRLVVKRKAPEARSGGQFVEGGQRRRHVALSGPGPGAGEAVHQGTRAAPRFELAHDGAPVARGRGGEVAGKGGDGALDPGLDHAVGQRLRLLQAAQAQRGIERAFEEPGIVGGRGPGRG